MNVKRRGSRTLRGAAAMCILAGLLLTAASPVFVGVAEAHDIPDGSAASFAGEADSEDATDNRDGRAKWRLEHVLTQLRLLLQILQDRLVMADETVKHLLQVAADLEADGRDTAGLHAAIEGFSASVSGARVAWDNASQTLDAPEGFDAEGNVVDRHQAELTVQQARDAMKDCRRTLQDATATLRRALREYHHEVRE